MYNAAFWYAAGMRPLEHETSIAVAFALGRVMEMHQRPPGLLATIFDELSARGLHRDLLATMDDTYATSLTTAVMLDRAAGKKAARR